MSRALPNQPCLQCVKHHTQEYKSLNLERARPVTGTTFPNREPQRTIMVEATRNRNGLMTPPSPPPVLNVRRHRIRPTLQPQKNPLNPWILRGPWNTDHRMRETGVYTRLFAGLVSPLASLKQDSANRRLGNAASASSISFRIKENAKSNSWQGFPNRLFCG